MDFDLEKIISDVPLIRLKNFEDNEVYVLLEKFNVTGSIKVKTVYRILKDALQNGTLQRNKIILEASSGNTAISLAYFGRVLGINVQIILPKTTASCKKVLIKSYGAEIIEIEGITDDCVRYRDELYQQDKDKYFIPDQFGNYANVWAHYHLTAPHILQQLGKIDFFGAGLGTSGTLLGTSLFLKEKNPDTHIVAINSIEKVEGLRNFKASHIQIPFYDEYSHIIDTYIDIDFNDAVVGVDEMLSEGYFVGISSGGAFRGIEKFLQGKKGLKGVFIAPDGGDYYFETLIKYINLKDYRGCR